MKLLSSGFIFARGGKMNDFRSLISLVNEFLEGYTGLDLEEILERIENAYENSEIEGHEYDYLTRLLNS